MDFQNFFYTLAQLIHNFGAVAVVATPICALAFNGIVSQRKLVWIVLLGWGLQAVSGASFGAISYYYYGKFPDINDIAMIALGIKMVCTAFGFILSAAQLFVNLSVQTSRRIWTILSGLGILALGSAAVLRWFS